MSTINQVERYEEETGEVRSLAGLAFHLHFKAYQACCNGITNVASNALSYVASPVGKCLQLTTRKLSLLGSVVSPVGKCLQLTRNLSVVDFCYVTSLKVANRTYSAIYKKELVDNEAVKTLVQKKHEREILELKRRLGNSPVYLEFCEKTAQYINEFIPKYIGEKLTVLPLSTEMLILYKLGYPLRYLNYQLNKHTNYRDSLISNAFGRCVQGEFVGLRTNVAHCLASKSTVNSFLDFEHVLLNVCLKLVEISKKPPSQAWIQPAVHSFANSLSQQKPIDQFLGSHHFDSKADAFIARLAWHKTNNSLPKGLPDPDLVTLTSENLSEKLDESLNKYLEERLEKLFVQIFPKNLKSGFLGIFYFLEGKDALTQLFIYLLAEFGVKQIVDPHLFALAILNGSGVEVMEYELDGFGRNKRASILSTGSKIMHEATLKNANWESLNEIFVKSGLKIAPKSFEAILQKEEAKAQLKACISTMIYNMIKTDEFQHPGGILKNAREKASQLPFIGAATLSLHLLISGTFFSLDYLFKSKDEKKESYLTWMFKNLSGRALSDHLADRIIDLIYHPSWRITILQLIETIFVAMESPPINPLLPQPNTLKADLNKITDFLFQHFTVNSKIPFQEKIGSVFDYFVGDGTVKMFHDYIQPKDNPVLEKGLKSLLPTIKELLLYIRVTDSFRKESLQFDGDAKFWECFLRECLNQHVAEFALKEFPFPKRPTLLQLSKIREMLVDQYLSLGQNELRMVLSTPPAQGWLSESQSYMIISDYVPEKDAKIPTNPLNTPSAVRSPNSNVSQATGIVTEP